MKLLDLLEEYTEQEKIRTAIYVDSSFTDKLSSDLLAKQAKIIGNCTPREVVSNMIVEETDDFNPKDSPEKVEKMIGDFDRAVTNAIFKELNTQIAKSDLKDKKVILQLLDLHK